MFTENDLRDALQYSSRRAAVLDDEQIEPPAALRRTRRPGRFALPAAAAASVLVIAGGAVLLAGHDDSTAPSVATATTKYVPSVRQPSGPAVVPRPRNVGDAHVPADISGVVDRVQISDRVFANWILGGNGVAATGSSNVEHPIPGAQQLVDLNIVGPDAGLDASRIPRDHPVQIAGTTGYYSNIKLFPIDGKDAAYSDKYLPHWTIAFPTPSGDWAFVHIEKVVTDADPVDVSVATPTAIVAAYDDLGVTFTSGGSRVPLRTGYLPNGMKLVQTSFATGSTDSGLVDVSFANGSKHLDIQMAPLGSAATTSGGGPSAVVGGYTVEVSSDSYNQETVRNVLQTLQVVDNARDEASYWTLAKAFG